MTGRNCLVLALWAQHPTLAEWSPLRNDPLSGSPFAACGWPLGRHFDIVYVTIHPWLYSPINLIEICLFEISSRKTNYFELTFSFFSFWLLGWEQRLHVFIERKHRNYSKKWGAVHERYKGKFWFVFEQILKKTRKALFLYWMWR